MVCDIRAAGLNPIDLHIIEGKLKWISRYKLPHAIGFDASGVVSSVGNDVTRFKVGDEVFVRAPRSNIGSFAERIVLHEKYFALKPKHISHEQSASLPLVALTTLQGLSDRAHIKAGQRILIHAGSGGVGTFAIQYAKSQGLHVTTTTSSGNSEFVKNLGADVVIEYDKEDYRSLPSNYDVVFDTLGGSTTLDSFKVCKTGGVVVSIAGPPDREFARQVGAGPLFSLIMRFVSRKVFSASRRTGIRYFRFLTESSGIQLGEISLLVDQGKVKPVIDKQYKFEDLPEALEYLKKGRARGKVVIKVS